MHTLKKNNKSIGQITVSKTKVYDKKCKEKKINDSGKHLFSAEELSNSGIMMDDDKFVDEKNKKGGDLHHIKKQNGTDKIKLVKDEMIQHKHKNFIDEKPQTAEYIERCENISISKESNIVKWDDYELDNVVLHSQVSLDLSSDTAKIHSKKNIRETDNTEHEKFSISSKTKCDAFALSALTNTKKVSEDRDHKISDVKQGFKKGIEYNLSFPSEIPKLNSGRKIVKKDQDSELYYNYFRWKNAADKSLLSKDFFTVSGTSETNVDKNFQFPNKDHAGTSFFGNQEQMEKLFEEVTSNRKSAISDDSIETKDPFEGSVPYDPELNFKIDNHNQFGNIGQNLNKTDQKKKSEFYSTISDGNYKAESHVFVPEENTSSDRQLQKSHLYKHRVYMSNQNKEKELSLHKVLAYNIAKKYKYLPNQTSPQPYSNSQFISSQSQLFQNKPGATYRSTARKDSSFIDQTTTNTALDQDQTFKNPSYRSVDEFMRERQISQINDRVFNDSGNTSAFSSNIVTNPQRIE
ncbi:hypothetical protein EDEG_03761 [Edhazardia aedis USNM 41457]|uniref:Uncharacterized protein n=1 Tax=Edhazardia aedis (strain USNM 41457) TaxID=1003232 RepID=J8ZPT7_EDHAE|nr:hypothetical protein EDEG_03761 [Edhazardia aedis USNM 41457]|eukprot:EJW01708.1 hypothetical protein EDEG_03761 [Edhazardia aedis USNM 41457]